MRNQLSKLTLAFILILALSSCNSNKKLSLGIMGNDDITIRATDGSFIIKSDSRFTPSFYTAVKRIKGEISTGDYMNSKGKDVKIKVSGIDEPFYGRLEFNQVKKEAYGKSPAARSYYINIPREYIYEAENGKVSVVYEYYEHDNNNYASWILWISDSPLIH